jgi:energy-converting hydrogenase Eha subunit A
MPLDLFDAVTFTAFIGLSIWLLVTLVAQSSPTRVWLGTDGTNAGDQMQYLGWIEQAAHHLVISNPFDANPSPADYLQPGLVLSGLLVRAGARASVAYLAWEPVAVIALFLTVRCYIRRLLPGKAARRFALVLALFYASPVAFLSGDLLRWLPPESRFFLQPVVTEMWPATYLWGYPFTAISLAALLGALLCYEQDRATGRVRPWAPLLALACSWLQPWQGATLLGVILASYLVLRLTGRRSGGWSAVATCVAAALPLGYYSLLGHVDPTWKLAGLVDFGTIPVLSITVAVIPLGLPALLAYRAPLESFQDTAVRAWPLVALGLSAFISITRIGTFPIHALQGLSIPLGILAVRGAQTFSRKLSPTAAVMAGVVVVALLVVPSGVQNLNAARSVGNAVFGPTPVFVAPGEQRALNYLRANPVPGAVLSPVYLGQAVPGITGRRTWVGLISWTPDYVHRVQQADALFGGKLSRAASARLIVSSGATFLLADCFHHEDLARLLPSIVEAPVRFGCAAVYRVRPVERRTPRTLGRRPWRAA